MFRLLAAYCMLMQHASVWSFSNFNGVIRSSRSTTLFSSPIEAADAPNANTPVASTQGNPPKGVWMPPSQNKAKRKGRVFSIQQPQDLLDFVSEDERLSVVKVYASWCKTCQIFDIRYRKLASQIGDKYDASGTITQKGRARFAEMQFDNPANEEMCQLLNANRLPYILMYKGNHGKIAEFKCGPAEFARLNDAVDEFADLEEEGEQESPMFVVLN